MTESLADPTQPESKRRRGMVFLDPNVVTRLEPADDRRGPGRVVALSGVAETLDLLGDPSRVTVIADGRLESIPELAAFSARPSIPNDFPPGSWFITGDPGWCQGDRPTGLRSILVGPRRPPARRPTLRCDLDARDLTAAVMEILVRETMV